MAFTSDTDTQRIACCRGGLLSSRTAAAVHGVPYHTLLLDALDHLSCMVASLLSPKLTESRACCDNIPSLLLWQQQQQKSLQQNAEVKRKHG